MEAAKTFSLCVDEFKNCPVIGYLHPTVKQHIKNRGSIPSPGSRGIGANFALLFVYFTRYFKGHALRVETQRLSEIRVVRRILEG